MLRTGAPAVGPPDAAAPAAPAATPTGTTLSQGVTKPRARSKARAKPAASSGRVRGKGVAPRAPAQTPAPAEQAGGEMSAPDSLETDLRFPDPPDADLPNVAWTGAEPHPGDSPDEAPLSVDTVSSAQAPVPGPESSTGGAVVPMVARAQLSADSGGAIAGARSSVESPEPPPIAELPVADAIGGPAPTVDSRRNDASPDVSSTASGGGVDAPDSDAPTVEPSGAPAHTADSQKVGSPETEVPLGDVTESGEGLALASSVDFSLAQLITPPGVEPAAPPAAMRRRVVFIDVENTSNEAGLSGVLDEVDLDGLGTTTEAIAIGNWRVIGQGLARSLAARGVQLVHSAPAARVRDWSDLWIAVQAGIWLGRARAGDALDIISHDRAFDAIGDAASRLGVGFRRFTYGRGVSKPEAESEPRPTRTASGDGGRKRGGRGAGRGRGTSTTTESAATSQPALPPQAAGDAGEAHERRSATSGQIVSVLRRLTADNPPAGAAIDWLVEGLKQAGFHRPPGSLRLITRLKRIKDVEVLANGRLRLASSAPNIESQSAGGDTEARPAEADTTELDVSSPESGPEIPSEVQIGEQEGVVPKRRSRRRGGRRRGGGGRQESTELPTAAGNPPTEEDG
ncbi:MAG: hypothetical protein ACI8PT_003068 [Gammaproteobacteria bacterium]|jgi:hypothetical protein